MRKLDIAKQLTGQLGTTEREAGALLDGILDLFKATLRKGEPITIPNFGKFTVRSKAPRPGRNPRTGEGIMIAARRVVIFSASRSLKNAVHVVPRVVQAVSPKILSAMPSTNGAVRT